MTQKKRNLPLTIVLLALIEGLAICLNLVAHPQDQPTLTIAIVILFAVMCGAGTWYATRIRGMEWG